MIKHFNTRRLSAFAFAIIFFATTLFTASAARTVSAVGGDESTPIVEKAIKYKNWTFADLETGKPVSLREFARGKRLVLVVYFAPWCGNWKNEAPLVARLYDKYKQHGFDVVAINNYGTRAQTKQFFGEKGAPYTVVVESETADARDKTSHYECRMQTGDARKWGSPYNVFVEPAKINPQGDVLMESAFVASGELIEADAEKFIRAQLGMDQQTAPKPSMPTANPVMRTAAVTRTASLDANERIYMASEVTQRARILSKPEPPYTERARNNKVAGKVVLRMVLRPSGEISDITVVRGLPDGLTEQSIEVAKKIKFEPAIKDGRRVAQYMQSEYNFYVFAGR